MYAKLFASMPDGSLHGKFEAAVTLMAMLPLADCEGNVDMMPEAIAAKWGWSVDLIKQGIAELEKPDPMSRTPDENGRRIIKLEDSRPWGWRIVNYIKYANMRSADQRREYFRNKKREYRERDRLKREPSTMSTNVHNGQHESTDVDVDVDVSKKDPKPAFLNASSQVLPTTAVDNSHPDGGSNLKIASPEGKKQGRKQLRRGGANDRHAQDAAAADRVRELAAKEAIERSKHPNELVRTLQARLKTVVSTSRG